MRFSRTNMRLAAARCRSLSRKIGVQTAEFSITAFCWRNADSRKSRTYERHNAEIRLELFNLRQAGAGGAGQQDGSDRLGAAGQRWGLPSSGCGGVGAVTTARLSRRGRVTGEGWRTV